MSRTLAACLLALTASACIEDSTYGLEVAPVELPRGVTRPLHMIGAQPPLDAILIDVDDPTIASVRLADSRHAFEVHARAEGTTVVHLLYRDQVFHVPTTVSPAIAVSLEVRPGDVSATIGGQIQLSAIAINTADEQVDVTPSAVWTVDDPRVARLYSDGMLQGMAAGTTHLRAEIDGVAQTAAVSISD